MFSHSHAAHTLLSAKLQCPHSSQSLSNSIPWQNLNSGFEAQQVSPGLCFSGKWQPHHTLSSSSLTSLFSGKSTAKMVKLLFFAKALHAILPTLYPELPKLLPHQRHNYSSDFSSLSVHPHLCFPPDVACRESKDSEMSFSIQLLQDHPMLSRTSLPLSLHIL